MTINHKPWFPGLEVPYVIALVSIEEQADVMLVTNIVECDPSSLKIGDIVEVRFEQAGDIWVPLFAPTASALACS